MIPDFQTIMLPLLTLFKDKEEKTTRELRESMVSFFNISEEEQMEKTPSGKQFLYYNRVAWAIAYLKMANLISSPSRAVYKLTNEGNAVLENPPTKITISFLKSLKTFQKIKIPKRMKTLKTLIKLPKKLLMN